jgi:hypothetical protein
MAREVLFPYLERARRALAWDGPGLVIEDGFTCHSGDFFLDECTYGAVDCLFLPLDSSDQIQLLDLGAFTSKKCEAAKSRPHTAPNRNSRKRMKMLGRHWKATCRDTIIGAFRRAGITAQWDPKRRALIAKVCRKTAESVRDWTFSQDPVVVSDEADTQ